MNLYSISLTQAHYKAAHKQLSAAFSGIQHTHIGEAFASALGFNTAMGANNHLKGLDPQERHYARFHPLKFLNRLKTLGHSVDERRLDAIMDGYGPFPPGTALPFVVTYRGIVQEAWEDDIAEALDSFPDPKQVALCKSVLSKVRVEHSTHGKSTSYGYKHKIEAAFKTYISNGSMIQAALELGLSMDIGDFDYPNGMFYFCDEQFEAALLEVSNASRDTMVPAY